MDRRFLALAAVLALAACNKPDTASETANSARADAAMSDAGDHLKEGLGKIGDAATDVASGVAAGGKVLVKKSRDAASDAASDVSTAASKASSKLKD
jgi:hypothetical protein